VTVEEIEAAYRLANAGSSLLEYRGELDYKCDQNGVVWFSAKDGPAGMLSKDAYECLRDGFPYLKPYEELPAFDNRTQNIVDVS